MGVAAAFRNNLVLPSGARVRLDREGVVTVETDMTDIGTGSYTIIAQTAAEMMGVTIDKVGVQLGDSRFPVSSGSGGQFGANCSTSGVYAACVKLREAVAQKLGFNSEDVVFENGEVRSGNRSVRACRSRGSRVDSSARTRWSGAILPKTHQQSTFGAHFVEVGVDVATGENAYPPHAGGLRGWTHPQSDYGAQPGDRRDDDGCRRGACPKSLPSTPAAAFSSTTISPAMKCRCMPTSRTRR